MTACLYSLKSRDRPTPSPVHPLQVAMRIYMSGHLTQLRGPSIPPNMTEIKQKKTSLTKQAICKLFS